MTTSNTIQKIANAIGKTLNVKVWEKNGIARLYCINVGDNTKKMRTNAYIDLNSFRVVVTIECNQQPSQWIASQESKVEQSLAKYARYARMIAAKNAPAVEPIEKQIENIETAVINEELAAEPVMGYYTEWRSLRVAVNSYGKLATRNRQFVVACSTNKSKAPRGFVELTQAGYEYLLSKRNGEQMLEPYAKAPDYDTIAAHIIKQTVAN